MGDTQPLANAGGQVQDRATQVIGMDEVTIQFQSWQVVGFQ